MAVVALLTVVLLGSAPSALAAPKATLTARFSPDVLGRSTTLYYTLSISEPVAVETIDLQLPKGMSIAGSSLGLSECTAEVLKWEPEHCPPNSIMGHGTAMGGLQIDSQPPRLLTESARVLFALGPSENTNPTILILVETREGLASEIVLGSQLAPSTSHDYSYALQIRAPLQTVWPEGPAIALLHLQANIGGHGITYYRREHGQIISFKPHGFTEPTRCPRHGFLFSANLHFYNGTNATTHAHATCPAVSRRNKPQYRRRSPG